MSAASANPRSVGQAGPCCQAAMIAAVPLNLWGFAAITVPLVATPGASTAVVLRNSLAGGVRSGVATAIGANTGSICYGLLTAFGVAVALERWPMVWAALRVAGT